ncbi:mediator of RNA polymerase II transcription subunit 17-like [Saccostrea cucullata]|uniref:mediator of RNA polymerase II transcription subunit 17-like n=1 Tax=Saccostrea cuccullata TaxID=36930 RepID=UPI002ED40CC2
MAAPYSQFSPSPTPAVNVSVEAVLESQIQEVRAVEKPEAPDGHEIQEIYVPPLSMSENLTKLAQKIDFYKDESDEKGKPTSEGEKEEEEKTVAAFQPSLWPWDSVRTKLRASHTEMSVLLDILNIASSKEKRYMVLDPVQQNAPDPKLAIQLMSKRRALQSAASVLQSGAERLRKSQAEINSKNDFHLELLNVRQSWRLKKTGTSILGDLSYRSVGSRYLHNGVFEVVKSSDLNAEGEFLAQRGSLDVVVPTELEGAAYIQVEVKSVPDTMDLTGAILKIPSGIGPVRSETYWQQKLEKAQNVLFCKEIFAQLAREAVQSKSSVPHLVVGNQIITNVFPGIQLSIVLCHSTGKEKEKKLPQYKMDHNHVLEHSLHQLLRENHFKNINFPAPHPVTALVGLTKRRRLAGPNALSRKQLMEMSESESMLDQIIKQTKHNVLRLRTMQTIDGFAATLSDPQLTVHWSCCNSSTEASCRVIITSQGYDLRVWHSFVIIIGVDSLKVIIKEGRVFFLSFEEKELQDFIMWQVSQHQISVSQNLARLMGWQIMSTSTAMGVSDLESSGTASSLILAAPSKERILAIKSGPSSGIKVFLQLSQKDNKNRVILPDSKWQSVGADFQQVDLTKFEGRNFASKLELLLATLSHDSSQNSSQ